MSKHVEANVPMLRGRQAVLTSLIHKPTYAIWPGT